MNIVVIGLGSMGKRRIRLLKEMYPDYSIYGVDNRKDRRDEAFTNYAVSCYDSIDSIELKIDACFVCTSPLTHNQIIKKCISFGWNVFTELNLVSDGYEENIVLSQKMGVTLFLSSTFLFREEIKYIKESISNHNRWNYVYHIGQYLPEWHPWENYDDIFLSDKRTNGCREILAIELPWLVWAFGDVADIYAVSDKISDLSVEYNDNFLIQLTHNNGNKGCLIVDVVSPVAVRRFEAYREHGYISWSGTPDSLCEYDFDSKQLTPVSLNEYAEHINGYSSFIVENAYRNEIKEFFDVVNNLKSPIYGFEKDKIILEMIDKIGA